jgi:hypothetical protein
MNPSLAVIALLRDRPRFLAEIDEGIGLKTKIASLLITSFICFAVYGAIVGAFHSVAQTLSSAIKLPALYLITLLVCLPTLYIFNSLFGAKKTLGQHFAYLLSAVSVIGLLLCGFAPVSLFVLTTISVKDYSFFLLVNVFFFALTGVVGVVFLYQVMRPLSDGNDSQSFKVRTNILRFWLGLYGFVGSQLGWTLRPFFGSPGRFELFRPKEGNFFWGVWNAIMNLFHHAG